MAELNPNIILSGQPFNALASISAGAQAADQLNTLDRQNALADLYKTQGAGIASGDQGALNALAALDPTAALGVQKDRLGMDATRQNMANDQARLRIMNAQESRAASEYAAGLDEKSRAAQAAQIEDAVKMGMAIPDEATWDQTMGRMEPSLVGQFGNRQVLANRYMDMADILKGQNGPTPLSAQGKVQADINSGILPQGTPLSSGGVTVNTGDNSGAFQKKSDEQAATRYNDYITSADQATQVMGDLQSLTQIGTQIKTGKGAQAMAMIGPYAQALGINVDGLDAAQAYQSIVNRMAPNMRPVGSGASSDRDVSIFMSSLPGLGNTPGGNELIQSTLQAVQKHNIAAGEIANDVVSGKIQWQEGDRRIRALGNPYEGFNDKVKALDSGTQPTAKAAQPQANMSRVTTDADYDALPSGATFIDPNGVTRRKP